mmetsp:Transcript_36347/g.104667  ORF Transcript_36347/g.104667 Transcript_36347/m.104667 type:complete len:299 (-) Transcript_36347:1038-1934(-)
MSIDDFQDEGNKLLASSRAKLVLRKCSSRLRRRMSSPLTRVRRPDTYEGQVRGGMNLPPSLRLSDIAGLKTSLSSCLHSSSSSDAESFDMADQKALPGIADAQGDCASPSKAPWKRPKEERSILPRSRSTPWALTVGAVAARSVGAIAARPVGSPPPIMEKAVGAGPRLTMMASARGAVGSSGAIAASCILSRPKSTPPYTPCRRESMPLSTVLIWPFSTLICEYRRSFQSWGICVMHGFSSSSAKLNHESSKGTFASTKYFARTVAFANSRKWKNTLFLSAIRSKLFVNASAYLTRG